MSFKKAHEPRPKIFKLAAQAAYWALDFLTSLFNLKENERIWLIGCGGERWGDNADAIWHYVTRYSPGITGYAVIKNEGDLHSKEGPWVLRNSIRNLLLLFSAEALLTTHSLSDIGFSAFADLTRAKKVWLQHGVIGIKKMPVADTKTQKFDLICASSIKEKRIMVEDMHLDPEKVYVTGLARYDRLQSRSKGEEKQVLYVPTFRDWVANEELHTYAELLFSWIDKFNSTVENYKVKVWLHPNWLKKDFVFSSDVNWELIKPKTDLQKILLESYLLVTDYSSVTFDAALAGIPVVFYQPDQKMYMEKRGLYENFIIQDQSLVLYDEKELVDSLVAIINDEIRLEQRVAEDQKWALQYVETYDGMSCKRIVKAVESLLTSEDRV